jgi:predicted GNAT family N-acyltransferase
MGKGGGSVAHAFTIHESRINSLHPMLSTPVRRTSFHETMDITPVQSEDDWQQARAIREQVFVDEQGCPPDKEWDGHDETSRHILGWVEDEAVATARWRAVPDGEAVVAKLERIAVLPRHRGQCYGTQLVQALLDDARRAGFSTFLVHAQTHLQGWYEELDFEARGDSFEEAGIRHVAMIRTET